MDKDTADYFRAWLELAAASDEQQQGEQQILAPLADVLALFEEARRLMPLGTKKRAEWITRAAAAAERLQALLSH